MGLLDKNINFIWYGDSCETECTEYSFYNGANLKQGFENITSISQIKRGGFVFANWSKETDLENRASYEQLPDIIKNNLPKEVFVKDSQGFDKFECGKSYIVKMEEGTSLEVDGLYNVNLGSDKSRLLVKPCPTCPDPDDCGCTKVNLIFLNSQTRTGWTEQLSACMDFTTGTPLELFSSTTSLSVGTKLYLEERQYQDDGFSVSNQWVVANGILYRINGRSIVEIVDCEDIIPTPTPTPEFETPMELICVSDSTFSDYDGEYLLATIKHNNRPVWGPNANGAMFYYNQAAGASEFRWILSKALGSYLGQTAAAGELTDYPYDVDWGGDDDYDHTITTEECPTPTPTPLQPHFEPEVFYIDVCTTLGAKSDSFQLGDAVAVNGKPIYFNFREYRDSERWDRYGDSLISIGKTHSPVVLGESAMIETSRMFDELGLEVSMMFDPETEEIHLAIDDRVAYFYDQDESVYNIGADASEYMQFLTHEDTGKSVAINKTTTHGDIVVGSSIDSNTIRFYESDSNNTYSQSQSFVLNDSVGSSARKVTIRGDIAAAINNERELVVFKKVGGNWQETQKLSASIPSPNQNHTNSMISFGESVVITELGELLVGSPNQRGVGIRAIGGGTEANLSAIGAVYVFTQNSSGDYIQQQIIQPTNLYEGSRFGQDISCSGTTIVIGANDYAVASSNYSSGIDVGVVFVYEATTGSVLGTSFSQKAKIEGDTPISGQHSSTNFDNFGWSVAINGNWLVVGSPLTLNETDPNLPRDASLSSSQLTPNAGASGATYVFKKQGTNSWQLHQKLNLGENPIDKNFGWCVDISDDFIVVKANERRYVYEYVGGSWVLYSASNPFGTQSSYLGEVSTFGNILVHGSSHGVVVTDLSWYPNVCEDFDSTMSLPGFEIWPLLCGTGEFMEVWSGDNLCFEEPSPTPTPTPTPTPLECDETIKYCISGITSGYADYNGTYKYAGTEETGSVYWQQINPRIYSTETWGSNYIRERTESVNNDGIIEEHKTWVITNQPPTTELTYFVAFTDPATIRGSYEANPRGCPHEFTWKPYGVGSEYFTEMQFLTDECPQDLPDEFTFKKVEFGSKYSGWNEDDLYIACEDSEANRTVDTLILYRNYDSPLKVGTELFLPEDNRFHTSFSVDGNNPWIYNSGALFKMNGRFIVDIIDCDEVPTPTPTPVPAPWCGEPPGPESYICVQGSGETAGKFNRGVDGRYHYSLQSTNAEKTEWQSRNSLIYILFLKRGDSRNSIGLDIWAFYAESGTKSGILYYTTKYDANSYCPPLDSTDWIPTGQMRSRFVEIYGANDCGADNVDKIPCDVKDASTSGWIDIRGCKNTLNVTQTSSEQTNSNCNKNYKKYGDHFDIVVNRGAGTSIIQEVSKQPFRGTFTINTSGKPPGVGWYDYPGELPNACGTYEHIIEIPLKNTIDLVNLKTLTMVDANMPAINVDVFSATSQKWVNIGTITGRANLELKEFKNSRYNVGNPPIDGSDILSHSIAGVRLYVGTWNYNTNTGGGVNFPRSAHGSSYYNQKGGFGLTLYSIRIEGRDSRDCLPIDVTQFHRPDMVVPPSPPGAVTAPRLYPDSVQIVGENCIGTRLHGNYRYDGNVQDILYDWTVNGTSTSTYRYLDTTGLSAGDQIKFNVTFKYLDTKSTTYSASLQIEKCKTLLPVPNDTTGTLIYFRRTSLPDTTIKLTGFGSSSTLCGSSYINTGRRLTVYWRGNLGIGTKLSSEKQYQTYEEVDTSSSYFYHVEKRRVLRLSANKSVTEILRCPPVDITLSGSTIREQSSVNTEIGTLTTLQENSAIKYSLVTGSGSDHNHLVRLSGRDYTKNLIGMNVVTSYTKILYSREKSLNIRVRATLAENNSLYFEKRFIINVTAKPPEYFSCHNIRVSGFEDGVLNGVYAPQLNTNSLIYYKTYNGKYIYRTAFYEDTNKYSQMQWSSTKGRWEIYVKTDPSISTKTSTSAKASAADMLRLIRLFNIQPRTTNPTGIFSNNKTIATISPNAYTAKNHGHKSCPFPFTDVTFYAQNDANDTGTVTDAGKFIVGRSYLDL